MENFCAIHSFVMVGYLLSHRQGIVDSNEEKFDFDTTEKKMGVIDRQSSLLYL